MGTAGVAQVGLAPTVEGGAPPPGTPAEGTAPFTDAIAAALAAAEAGKPPGTAAALPGTAPATSDQQLLAQLLASLNRANAPGLQSEAASEPNRPDRLAEAGQEPDVAAAIPLPGLLEVPPQPAASPQGALLEAVQMVLEAMPEGTRGPVHALSRTVAAIEQALGTDVEAAPPGRGRHLVAAPTAAAPPSTAGRLIEALAAPPAAIEAEVPQPELARPAPAAPDASTRAVVDVEALAAREAAAQLVSIPVAAPAQAGVEAAVAEAAPASTGAIAAAATQPATPAASAAGAPGAAAAVLEVPVDTANPPVLVSRLADTVQLAARTNEGGIRLVLNPPQLGHLDIRVEDTQGGFRVSLVAGTREASELIQQQLPALRLALEARDLRVDRLEAQHGSNGLGGTGDQPQRRQDEQGERPRWSSVAGMDRAGDDSEPARAIGPTPEAGRLDLVA